MCLKKQFRHLITECAASDITCVSLIDTCTGKTFHASTDVSMN